MLKAENPQTGAPRSTVPEWAANATLGWQVSDRLHIALDAQHVGKMVGLDWWIAANAFGSQQIRKAFTLFDLSTNVGLSDTVTLNTGIRNLFNEQPNGGDDGNNFYTPGRRLFISLTGCF